LNHRRWVETVGLEPTRSPLWGRCSPV